MKFCRALVFCLLASGCAQPVSDNRASYDNARRLELREKAERGDAGAQNALGDSYCCGEDGFWDTKQASYWWCQAAKQGHMGAKGSLQRLGLKCPPASRKESEAVVYPPP